MKSPFLIAATFALICSLVNCDSAFAQGRIAKLSAADEKLLQSLLNDMLIDPQGAERVKATFKAPGRSNQEQTREGWLVRDKAGDRVYFADGENIAAPPKEKMAAIDFVANCQAALPKQTKRNDDGRIWVGRFGRHTPQPSSMPGQEPNLVLAAWLDRLGQTVLAARVMDRVPEDRDADVVLLRQYLAQHAFDEMLTCFESCHDEAALVHAERLLRLYFEESKQIDQAHDVFHDLMRRKQSGILGKSLDEKLTKEFERWDRRKQIDHVLEYLDRRTDGDRLRFGGWDGATSNESLKKIGEDAVPALIDAMDSDNRLTRRVYYAHHRSEQRRVVSVREIALATLRDILRVYYLDPRGTDTDYYDNSVDGMKKAAAAARAYWKEFGPLPFEERMMRVINDPRSTLPAVREAVGNLAPERWISPHAVKDGKPNAALVKFKAPTAAEAVLLALDRELSNPFDAAGNWRGDDAHDLYFAALIQLGDRRVAAELAKRADAEFDTKLRLYWAYASYRLGEPRPIRRFAEDFALAKLSLPKRDDRLNQSSDLGLLIDCLSIVRLPEADRALFRLADPKHAYHSAALDGMLHAASFFRDNVRGYLQHPVCLDLLRGVLDDKSATQIKISVTNNSMNWSSPNGGASTSQVPAILADPNRRKKETMLRRCDRAAEMMHDLIWGAPEYHPLLIDADKRLEALREFVIRFAGKYRRLSESEQKALALDDTQLYAPDLRPLMHPASAADVKAGLAIFHLDGQGKIANVPLPSVCIWKKSAAAREKHAALIVQAEVNLKGQTIYGVIDRHGLHSAPASEFADVRRVGDDKK